MYTVMQLGNYVMKFSSTLVLRLKSVLDDIALYFISLFRRANNHIQATEQIIIYKLPFKLETELKQTYIKVQFLIFGDSNFQLTHSKSDGQGSGSCCCFAHAQFKYEQEYCHFGHVYDCPLQNVVRF